MGLQAILTKQAFEMLPRVLIEIESANDFESNQMTCYAERKLNNSRVALVDMTEQQINEFENDLIETFKFNNWIL